ncbi:MAG: hypothetical protein WCH99_13780 [Verrucomicrobiota bacterium]
MKLIISESLRYNLNSLIPVEKATIGELMRNFTNNSSLVAPSFKQQCLAARFIFDEVSYFSAKGSARIGNHCDLLRSLMQIATKNSDGTETTVTEWANAASSKVINQEQLLVLNEILDACIPSRTIPEETIILSNDPFITAEQVHNCKSLNHESILYLLATAGIDIVLPCVVAKEASEIESLKKDFEAERLDYLLYIEEKLHDLLEASVAKAPDTAAIYEFASREFALELKLKAQRINAVAKKSSKNAVEKIRVEFLDQTPAIAKSLLQLDFVGGGKGLFKVLLAAAKGEDEVKKVTAEYKEAAYLYRLSTND